MLAVALVWSGAGSVLSLAENTVGATPSVTISEPSPNVSLLKIDLGAGHAFAAGSTTGATGLTYQNAGSPATSQYATIDISQANNVSSLVATLPGDGLTLGQIRDLKGGVGSITASAATIEVTGINTAAANGSSGLGNVDLRAAGNLTVDAGAIVTTGTGTISLAADVNADGTGNDGVGTLSIGAGATVVSTNTTASAITLRGAAVNIDTSSNPAVVGAERSLGVTPAATLTGLSLSGLITPATLVCDGSGDLFVPNPGNNTVSEFAPGSTTPSKTLTGLDGPSGMALDANGNLFVANALPDGSGSISEFAPGGTTPTQSLAGSTVDEPDALAFDGSGNLYAYNWFPDSLGSPYLNKFTPGSTTPVSPPATTGYFGAMGSGNGYALAIDGAGHVYTACEGYYNSLTYSYFTGAISEVTFPNSTSFSYYDQFGNAWFPYAIAFDGAGNLYVDDPYWGGSGCVFKLAPGATTPEAVLTGLNKPLAMAFDNSGNLYVASAGNNTVSEFAPGATTPSETLTGTASDPLNNPDALTFDSRGDLFVANKGNNTVSEFTPGGGTTPVAGGVVVRSSQPSRPISLGGGAAVNGINLTQAELARIQTTAAGTMTIGDSGQTGNITLTAATAATIAGAATAVVESNSGPGQIILDDQGTGTGLNGNTGAVSLAPGTGGVVATLYSSGVPLATAGFNAAGLTFSPTLTFAPTPGTQVTVVENTATPAASNPISGTFANLPQGGTCTIPYLGTLNAFQANYQGGDGNDLVLTYVPPAPSTTALDAAPDPSVYGQAVAFTATVSPSVPGAGTPTGSVTFEDDGVALPGSSTVALSGGTASLATSALAVGSHSITAVYSGDASFTTSTSASTSQIVNQAGTTTALAGPTSPSAYGPALTFTATVGPVAPGAGTPTGSVTFEDGTQTLGTRTLAGGTLSLTISTLPAGSHSITAVYSGDANFITSTSVPCTQTITAVAPTITWKTPTAITYGTALSAAQLDAGAGIGGSYSYSPALGAVLHAGARTLSVTFTPSDATDYTTATASVSLTVNPAVLTATADPKSRPYGAANPSLTYTPTGLVNGDTAAVIRGSPVLSTTASTASVPGVYPINITKGTLSAADYSFNLVAGSLTVTQAQTNTAVGDLTNPSTSGQLVSFSATVSPVAPGAGIPAGTVTFKDGGATLGSGTLVGGKATFTTSTLAVGVHSITAVYAGNTDFSTSTSTADSHRVQWATKITLSDSAKTSVFGQKVTLKATVAATTKGAGTPAGTVTFKDDTATLGTVALSKGSASLQVSTLAAGIHSITAVYNGDSGLTFAVSTSAVDNHTVSHAKTRTALGDSAKKDTAASGAPVIFTATVQAVAPGAGAPRAR